MNLNVIGIGEVLWDLLPTGAQMGGAPANFACHARALGARAAMVTRVGLDQPGRDILRRFEELGLPADTVQVDESGPTGTVTVELAVGGVPRFTIHDDVAWDRLRVTGAALEAVAAANAVCFGSLAQRREPSRGTIQQLVAATPENALRVFDINLRQHFYTRELIEPSLRLANVLKLNDAELPVLARMCGLHGPVAQQMESLAERFELRTVALTRGPSGSLLFAGGCWSDHPGAVVSVVDTVGAGDAFTAALVMGLLRKMDLDEINLVANEVARHVCSRAGATPPLPGELRSRFAPPVNKTAAGKLAGAPTQISTLR